MESIDKYLINLKSISKITGHKFYINNEKLIILKKDDIVFSLFRFYYNIDRNQNIENLIMIYNDIFLYITRVINTNINFSYYKEFENKLNHDNYYIENNDIENQYQNKITLSRDNVIEQDNISIESCRKLLDLKTALSESISGLDNLKLVYNNCNIIQSKLDILINNISNNLFILNRKVYN
jgi:hypothetical protein